MRLSHADSHMQEPVDGVLAMAVGIYYLWCDGGWRGASLVTSDIERGELSWKVLVF